MSELTYTSIPDTSDADYWIKTQNQKDRSTTFVPKDKDLHLQLKQKARKETQINPSYKDRNKK